MVSAFGIDIPEVWITSTCLFLISFYFMRRRNKDKNFPPGPTGLPLVGYLPFLGKNPAETYSQLAKKYGPILSVNIGMESCVVLNDYDVVLEALVKQGAAFSGRPQLYVFQKVTKGFGIIVRDYGDEFKLQRKFALTTFRGYGVGKKSMEDRITEEISFLSEVIIAKGEKPFNCLDTISNAVSNIICSIVMGSRFSYDDKIFIEMIRRLNRNFSDKRDVVMVAIMSFAPGIRFFPPFAGALKRFDDDLYYLIEMMGKFLEEHKRTIDVKNTRDFIDEYLKEMKSDVTGSFHEFQLLQSIRDYFLAGTETTSSTLRWCFLCFAHYPEFQSKLAKEIKEVIGEAIPSMKHRDQMPYTCAFIQEITRHRTLLPLSVPHKTNMDVTIGGYDIPKDTTVLPNLWAVHHDPKYFKDPDEFRPERFIDANGGFVSDNHVIPFSVGPRYCLGEQLARMEVFLFLTSIVQKFEIVPDPEKTLPSFDRGVVGFLEVPDSYEIKFQQR